ncbi:MAG: hypothetical protein ABW292_12135 [Vicinamibacterales bacterium]
MHSARRATANALPSTSKDERPVRSDRRVIGDWFVDLALAYLGGLMIGAPAGLAATWFIRHDLALTFVIVLAMLAVLAGLRRRRKRIAN